MRLELHRLVAVARGLRAARACAHQPSERRAHRPAAQLFPAGRCAISLARACSLHAACAVAARRAPRSPSLVACPPFDSAGPVPPPPTAAYSSDYSAAAAPATTTGLGWRVFGRIWADFGTEQRQPVMDDLLYPDQARCSAPHQPSPHISRTSAPHINPRH